MAAHEKNPGRGAPEPELSDSGYFSAEEYVEGEVLPFDPSKMQLIGSGGFGRCYRVDRTCDSLPMAVKITQVADDSEYLDTDQKDHAWNAFETELSFYEDITDTEGRPWCPLLYGSGTLNRKPWIAIELMGKSLGAMVFSGTAHPQFRHFALGALEALEGLHVEGYIHRDIKPENFVLRPSATTTADDAPQEVVLIDYGLVMPYRVGDINETEFLDFCGTAFYASDRQLLDRQLGPADDLESLGYSLLELYLGLRWDKIPDEVFDPPNKEKNRKLKHFAEQNQHLILPQRKRRRGGDGEAIAPAQEKEVKEEGDSLAQMKQAPPPQSQPLEEINVRLAIVMPHGGRGLAGPPPSVQQEAVTQPEAKVPSASAQQRTKSGGIPHDEILPLRNKMWDRLVELGTIPSFLEEWMDHCKSLGPGDLPDYELLKSLLQSAPEAAPTPTKNESPKKAAAAAPAAAAKVQEEQKEQGHEE